MATIILSAPVFDYPGGAVKIEALPSSDLASIGRRSNRIQTLDGGAVFNDTGYSAADRTLKIKWRIESEQQWDDVARLVKLYPLIGISLRDGYYDGNPQLLSSASNVGTLNILVYQQLSA